MVNDSRVDGALKGYDDATNGSGEATKCLVLLMQHGTRVRSVRRQAYTKKVLKRTKVKVGCSQRALEGSTDSEGQRNTKGL